MRDNHNDKAMVEGGFRQMAGLAGVRERLEAVSYADGELEVEVSFPDEDPSSEANGELFAGLVTAYGTLVERLADPPQRVSFRSRGPGGGDPFTWRVETEWLRSELEGDEITEQLLETVVAENDALQPDPEGDEEKGG